MAAGTVYLDVDDEITSAAARIRTSESPKVGLVVPYGSRISTSRMNFRLLSREAIVNNRRLSIIAGDPATRALAASAGLAVFATVGEYESALAGPPVSVDDYDGLRVARSEPTTSHEPVAPAAPPPAAASSEAPDRAPTRSGTRSGRPPRGTVDDETVAIGLPAAGGAVAGAAPAAATAPVVAAAAATAAPAPTVPVVPSPRSDTTGAVGRLPVRGAIGRVRVGTPVLVGTAAALLALVVVAVGAYLILPAANITVTPREQAIEPFTLIVTADPAATAVDPANDVIPATRVDIPVEVSDTFTATDKRVVQTPADGQVEFLSYNTGSENTIAKGSIVSTEGGIKFQTTAAVTLPRAQVIPPSLIRPSSRTVRIVAVKPGPAGNVPTNAITVVPPREDPTVTKVHNPDPTGGGTRETFPRIGQKDVDMALAALRTKLDEAFSAAVKEGAGAPAATTIFPETAVLGGVTPTTDPAKLVGQEVETFDLGLSASGTVIAVDPAPVAEIARSRLTANIGAGYRLVEGSDKIVQGDPVVADGVVTFPVTARATRVRILDAGELRAMVKGKPSDQARALLEPYGEVKIDTWPAWVSSITGFDARLSVTIGGPGSPSDAAESPSPAGPGTSNAPASSAAP